VQPKLLPGENFKRLVQGAEAARQDNEGVGDRRHLVFPVMHVVADDEFRAPGMADFVTVEEFWNDAGHHAASGKHRIGNQPHKTDLSAAIDETKAGLRQCGSQFARSIAVAFPDIARRAAIDTNRFNRRHAGLPILSNSASRQEFTAPRTYYIR